MVHPDYHVLDIPADGGEVQVVPTGTGRYR